MIDFLKELLEAPKELYLRGDSYISEKIKPTTKKLDNKNTKLKYVIGNNASIYTILITLTDLPSIIPIGVSSINYWTNVPSILNGLIHNEHKGSKEILNGNKIVSNPRLFVANNVSKYTRFASILEGSTQIGIGLYGIIAEKDSSPLNIGLIINGIKALNVGIGTYVFQANDEEPRKKKDLFSKTKHNLEKILQMPELDGVGV